VQRNIGELDCSALKERVGSRLLDVGAPLAACLAGRDGRECAAALASLRNPYAIEDDPGAFHHHGLARRARLSAQPAGGRGRVGR